MRLIFTKGLRAWLQAAAMALGAFLGATGLGATVSGATGIILSLAAPVVAAQDAQGSLWNPVQPKDDKQTDALPASTQKLVNKVLAKADIALAANRLTLPQHNNAYDRYRAVLQIAPGNIQAKAGLLKIRDTYLKRIDQAIAQEDLQAAKQSLAILTELYPGDSSVAEARRLLRKVAPKSPKALPAVDDLTIKRFQLPASDLRQRGPHTQAMLAALAERLEQTQESILIRARTDAEGRWIYQTLNAATPTFRVRGDIAIGKPPAIELRAPL